MRIKCGFEISYECFQPTPFIAQLSVHPSRRGDLESADVLQTTPGLATTSFIDTFGNETTRFTAPAGATTLRSEFVVRDSGLPDAYAPDAQEVPVEQLPSETLLFLMASR